MKTQKPFTLRRLFLLAGIGLLIAAAVLLFFWQRNIHTSAQQARSYVQSLSALIPEPQNAFPEERRDNTMPVLSLDDTNFVGILEMPLYESALPVCNNWGQSSRYPCRLSGSIYDGTMQIGATTQQGQYDFYREISVGDRLYFTDMEGNRYTYAVTDLTYTNHADQTALHRKDASLTLFIKNIYAFEYIIVFCNTLQL